MTEVTALYEPATYEVELCSSCLVWHFNGDDSGLEAGDPRPMSVWDNEPRIGRYIVDMLQDEPHFSSRHCDGCDALPGDRIRCDLITLEA